jgi:hypothetical protein
LTKFKGASKNSYSAIRSLGSEQCVIIKGTRGLYNGAPKFNFNQLFLEVEGFKVVEQGETRGCRNCDVQVVGGRGERPGGRPTFVDRFIYSVYCSRPCLASRRLRGRVFCSPIASNRMPSCSCKVGACRTMWRLLEQLDKVSMDFHQPVLTDMEGL